MTRELQARVEARGDGEGYVWVDSGVAVLYSYYVSPNIPLLEFEEEIGAWSSRSFLRMAGNFNTTTTE